MLICSGSLDTSRSPGWKQKFSFCPPTSFPHLSAQLPSPSPTTPPPGRCHQFPRGVRQEPQAPAGRKKRGALERPSVQRSAFSEVTLVGRGSFHVLTQFAREGIPKAWSGLWLREFFFLMCRNDKDVGVRFSVPSPSPPATRKLPEPQSPPRQEKADCPFLISLSC